MVVNESHLFRRSLFLKDKECPQSLKSIKDVAVQIRMDDDRRRKCCISQQSYCESLIMKLGPLNQTCCTIPCICNFSQSCYISPTCPILRPPDSEAMGYWIWLYILLHSKFRDTLDVYILYLHGVPPSQEPQSISCLNKYLGAHSFSELFFHHSPILLHQQVLFLSRTFSNSFDFSSCPLISLWSPFSHLTVCIPSPGRRCPSGVPVSTWSAYNSFYKQQTACEYIKSSHDAHCLKSSKGSLTQVRWNKSVWPLYGRQKVLTVQYPRTPFWMESDVCPAQ